MSWLDRIRNSLRPRTHPPLRSPTAAYPTPVDMYERLLDELETNWHAAGWAHFEADAPDEPIVIQVAAPDTVNTCNEPIDLPAILRTVGLDALAGLAERVDDDASLHRLPGVSNAELAQVVHAIFIVHESLGEGYAARGWLEG